MSLVVFTSQDHLYKTQRIKDFLKDDKQLICVNINHLCPFLEDFLAGLVLRPQEHGSMKVLFFSDLTYHVVKLLVAEDYQQVLTMIDEEENLEVMKSMKSIILDLLDSVPVGSILAMKNFNNYH